MVKIGLVGVGYLGKRHLGHLISLDHVEVSGIWDTDVDVLNETATEFDVAPAENLQKLIHNSDAIVVVTPTSSHFEIGLQVLEASKPLFIEKPICATTAQAKTLVETSHERGVPIQVGHIERFNKAFRSLKEIEVKPRFIEVHRLASWVTRGADVAVVSDLMIHDLDLILALTDATPDHIHANGVNVISNSIDIATARIEFSNGMVANVTASRISLKRMRKMRLFGEHEYVVLDLDKKICEYISAVPGESELPPDSEYLASMELNEKHLDIYKRTPAVQDDDAMRLELQSFVNVVANNSKPIVTGDDGLKAVELAERIVRIIGKSN